MKLSDFHVTRTWRNKHDTKRNHKKTNSRWRWSNEHGTAKSVPSLLTTTTTTSTIRSENQKQLQQIKDPGAWQQQSPLKSIFEVLDIIPNASKRAATFRYLFKTISTQKLLLTVLFFFFKSYMEQIVFNIQNDLMSIFCFSVMNIFGLNILVLAWKMPFYYASN